jgi:hypothetical protein
MLQVLWLSASFHQWPTFIHLQSILAIRGGLVPRKPGGYGKREYGTFSLALHLDAIINYKNNKKREPREQGSSLSLLEPICDAAR